MLIRKLQSQFGITVNESIGLMELCDTLESSEVPYYYVSYNDEDIVSVASEENLVVEIYEYKGGYIGFQEGVIW